MATSRQLFRSIDENRTEALPHSEQRGTRSVSPLTARARHHRWSAARAVAVCGAASLCSSCSDPVGPARPSPEFAFLHNGTVLLADIDGGTPTPLLPEISDARVFAWSPSGRTLAVGVGSTLVLLDIETEERRSIPISTTAGPLQLATLAWSPDGDRILLLGATTGRMYNDIYTVRADGSDLRRLTQTPRFKLQAQWSPDGRRILFVEVLAPEPPYEIVIMNADGSSPVYLARGLRAEWSPDGRHITFDDDRDAFVTATDGSRRATIARAAAHDSVEQFIEARWSPGSDRIIVTGVFWTSDLWSVASDGSGIVRLTTVRNALHAHWSPDGRHILYVTGSNISVMAADGSGQRVVFPEWSYAAAWRPSSR